MVYDSNISRYTVPDPLLFGHKFWPSVNFYNKQHDIITSVRDNKETVVAAGNELGKDFVAGFIILWFFMTRHPCRIVTTSAKDDHLDVLWGEINAFILSCEYPLTVDEGGPLIVNNREIRKVVNGEECPTSYVKGLVASADSIAAMQGHHANPRNLEDANDGIPRTLFVSDESSSVPDAYYKMAITWAKRLLIFGNTWPCHNFFRKGVSGGDIANPDAGNYYRKVLKIVAEDSPNVRYGLKQRALGLPITNTMVVPGVKSYETYNYQITHEDPHWIAVSLHAEFYEGPELKMYPATWLTSAKLKALQYQLKKIPRRCKAIGCDTGEGSANTSWYGVDEYGIVFSKSMKTPDTSIIPNITIALMREYSVPSEMVLFDRGGGGYQHACDLRSLGYNIRTVGFGESISLDPKRGMTKIEEKKDTKEERYAFTNRRAEMYWDLRTLLNPNIPNTFGISAKETELLSQLEKYPLQYDGEGRVKLPPKNRKPGEKVDENKPTLVELIGHSPDEADALVLAVHGMLHKKRQITAGVPL